MEGCVFLRVVVLVILTHLGVWELTTPWDSLRTGGMFAPVRLITSGSSLGGRGCPFTTTNRPHFRYPSRSSRIAKLGVGPQPADNDSSREIVFNFPRWLKTSLGRRPQARGPQTSLENHVVIAPRIPPRRGSGGDLIRTCGDAG